MRLQFVLVLTFQLPVRLVDKDKDARATAIMISTSMMANVHSGASTHTVPSRTNSSLRWSFIVFCTKYLTRYATFEGLPSSSTAGISILCLRVLEKSISRPPLLIVSYTRFTRRITYVNSITKGTMSPIVSEPIFDASSDE